MNRTARPTPSLAAQWLEAKAAEKAAETRRRELEDLMSRAHGIDATLEGTLNFELAEDDFEPGYKVKIVGRMNRKVNGEELQDLAREAGLEQFLTTLFKWEPDLRLAAWKATDKSITDKLAGAITTTPGRPSFSVEVIDQKTAL